MDCSIALLDNLLGGTSDAEYVICMREFIPREQDCNSRLLAKAQVCSLITWQFPIAH